MSRDIEEALAVQTSRLTSPREGTQNTEVLAPYLVSQQLCALTASTAARTAAALGASPDEVARAVLLAVQSLGTDAVHLGLHAPMPAPTAPTMIPAPFIPSSASGQSDVSANASTAAGTDTSTKRQRRRLRLRQRRAHATPNVSSAVNEYDMTASDVLMDGRTLSDFSIQGSTITADTNIEGCESEVADIEDCYVFDAQPRDAGRSNLDLPLINADTDFNAQDHEPLPDGGAASSSDKNQDDRTLSDDNIQKEPGDLAHDEQYIEPSPDDSTISGNTTQNKIATHICSGLSLVPAAVPDFMIKHYMDSNEQYIEPLPDDYTSSDFNAQDHEPLPDGIAVSSSDKNQDDRTLLDDNIQNEPGDLAHYEQSIEPSPDDSTLTDNKTLKEIDTHFYSGHSDGAGDSIGAVEDSHTQHGRTLSDYDIQAINDIDTHIAIERDLIAVFENEPRWSDSDYAINDKKRRLQVIESLIQQRNQIFGAS